MDYFNPDVVSAQDYYPFGMMMVGREYGSSYRFGFNGKENDNEVKGEGNQYDYGFRIYDPRIGRFLSVDPLFKSYPWYTPYQFAGNMPIWAIDLDGLEEMKANSVANVIKDINGNIITKPTIIKDKNHSTDLIPGVRRINANEIEVTPGLIEKPHPYWNTFTYEQINGKDFVIKQSNTPIGQEAGGTVKPPKTNLQQDNEDDQMPTGQEPQLKTITEIHTQVRVNRRPGVVTNLDWIPATSTLNPSSNSSGVLDNVANNAPNGPVATGNPNVRRTRNSVVTITLRTNALPAGQGLTIDRDRRAEIRRQLRNRGIPNRNIRFNPTQFNLNQNTMGGNPNQVIFNTTTTTTTNTTTTRQRTVKEE